MPITEKQREQRLKHIGSSDVAALLGCNPWQSTYDLWLEKSGKADGFAGNKYTEVGSALEVSVLNEAEKVLGKLVRNQYRSRPDLHLGANIDAILVDEQVPVEGKTGGLFGPLSDEWGAAGTDDVPDTVIAQCHAHMICMDAYRCYVMALLGGRGFVLYIVPRHETLVELISEKTVDFWEQNVLKDIPPTDLPTTDVIRRIRRQPNKTVDVDPELVAEWLKAKEVSKTAEKRAEDAQRALLAALGDAEGGNAGELGSVTYFEQAAKRVSSTLVKERMIAEVAAQYMTESRYRVLRHKKIKGKRKEQKNGDGNGTTK